MGRNQDQLGKKSIEKDAARLRVLLNQSTAPAAAVDHGLLAGLTDDDHSQYASADGSGTRSAYSAERLNKTVTAGDGLNGGGALTDNITLNAVAGDGIAVDPTYISVDESFNFEWTGAHSFGDLATFNAGAKIASGQVLAFGDDVGLEWAATDVLGLVSGDSIRSGNYASGISGWAIDSDGSAEFQNVIVRGEIRAAVFVKDLIEAKAGSLVVAISAGALIQDADVVNTNTLPNGYDFYIYFNDPPGGGFLFSDGDYCRLKTEYASGLADVWISVHDRNDQGDGTQRYSAAYQSGTLGITLPAGSVMVDYGTTGDGYVMLTADDAGTLGYGPNMSIGTWATNPWTSGNHTLRFRAGNMRGAFGTGATDRYGLGVGDYSAGNYLSYNAESADGFILKAGGGALEINESGMFIAQGSGQANKLQFSAESDSTYVPYIRSRWTGSYLEFLISSETNGAIDAYLLLQARSNVSGSSTDVSLDMLADDGTPTNSQMEISIAGNVADTLRWRTDSNIPIMSSGGWVWDHFWAHDFQTDVRFRDQAHLAGTAAAPALAQYGNSDTGIYFSGGLINFSQDGTLRLSVGDYLQGGEPAACRVRRTSSLSVSNNSNTNPSFASEARDTWGMHDNSTNPERITVPVAGWYLVTATCQWEAYAVGHRTLTIYHSGGLIVATQTTQNNGGTNVVRQTVTGIFYCAASDYFYVDIYQNSGVALDFQADGSGSYPTFSVSRIS